MEDSYYYAAMGRSGGFRAQVVGEEIIQGESSFQRRLNNGNTVGQ